MADFNRAKGSRNNIQELIKITDPDTTMISDHQDENYKLVKQPAPNTLDSDRYTLTTTSNNQP